MRITREGILPVVLLSALALAAGALHPPIGLVFWICAAAVAFFFRDPRRVPPPGSERKILSPADGLIRSIEEMRYDPHLKRPFRCVSIVLSLLDVHVNRVPVTGQVRQVTYIPGRFLPAFHRQAPRCNESNWIVIDSGAHLLQVRQIAGVLARRIVCDCRQGDRVRQGERLGIIRFGSCVQLYLPELVAITVRVGQRVRAGETPIGTLP